MTSIRAGFFDHDDRRTIAVRRWMIDATRDDDGTANYAAALLLAQITFWTQPDERTGKVRAGHDHGAHAWLVRSDDQWSDELGMTARTARRARQRLVALGWIEARTLVDGGVRCSHLRRLTPDTEPSTIRPLGQDADAGSGQMQPPVLAESRARASTTSLRDVPGEVPAADAAARELVTAFWTWSKEQRGTEPTLTSNGSGSPFMALVKIVQRLLVAGWADADVKRALIATPAYTVNALTLQLNQAKGTKASGPRAPITSRRDGTSGRVVDL